MGDFHNPQAIRDRVQEATPGRNPSLPSPQDDPEIQDPDSPESRAKASAAQQNAEMQKAAEQKKTPAATAEQKKAQAAAEQKKAQVPAVPLEFQSEAWQAAYVQRIDATIAALKSANVPVFWVGLPPQRDSRQSAAAVYLNELYRTRAERAGIIYVDVWDGFVDEAGRYVLQGPDFEGQIRRLRSGDGLYFTRAGARKLAHYVEREILRSLFATQTPVALPAPEPAVLQPGRGGTARPLAGPVVPLTASIGGGNELLGGGPARPTGSDPLATRVLIRGEPVTAPVGRADNFAWPRSGVATISEGEPEDLQASPQQPAPSQQPASTQQPAAQPAPQRPAGPRPRVQQQQQQQQSGDAKQQPAAPRRVPAPPRASNDGIPRPPLGLFR